MEETKFLGSRAVSAGVIRMPASVRNLPPEVLRYEEAAHGGELLDSQLMVPTGGMRARVFCGDVRP